MTGVGDLARLEAVSARTGAPTPELRLAYAAGGQESMLRQSVSALRASALPTERARWHTRLGDYDAAFGDPSRASRNAPCGSPSWPWFQTSCPGAAIPATTLCLDGCAYASLVLRGRNDYGYPFPSPATSSGGATIGGVASACAVDLCSSSADIWSTSGSGVVASSDRRRIH